MIALFQRLGEFISICFSISFPINDTMSISVGTFFIAFAGITLLILFLRGLT